MQANRVYPKPICKSSFWHWKGKLIHISPPSKTEPNSIERTKLYKTKDKTIHSQSSRKLVQRAEAELTDSDTRDLRRRVKDWGVSSVVFLPVTTPLILSIHDAFSCVVEKIERLWNGVWWRWYLEEENMALELLLRMFLRNRNDNDDDAILAFGSEDGLGFSAVV